MTAASLLCPLLLSCAACARGDIVIDVTVNAWSIRCASGSLDFNFNERGEGTGLTQPTGHSAGGPASAFARASNSPVTGTIIADGGTTNVEGI